MSIQMLLCNCQNCPETKVYFFFRKTLLLKTKTGHLSATVMDMSEWRNYLNRGSHSNFWCFDSKEKDFQ